ncbi:hypothetical protein SALBM135S_03105 [Streptomyces alboniger]
MRRLTGGGAAYEPSTARCERTPAHVTGLGELPPDGAARLSRESPTTDRARADRARPACPGSAS